MKLHLQMDLWLCTAGIANLFFLSLTNKILHKPGTSPKNIQMSYFYILILTMSIKNKAMKDKPKPHYFC